MQSLRNAAIVCLFTLSILSGIFAQESQPLQEMAEAPPIREGKVTAASELGLWDDAFVDPSHDVMIMRRNDELYSLAMNPSSTPKKISKVPEASNTQTFTGAAFEDKFWLFINSTNSVPSAIDARSGTVVSFEIPGLAVPGSQTPRIQSCIIVRHAQSAVVAISGGDRDTWPRPGNGPVYYWFNLKSGKVIPLPIGWHLNYFSDDEIIAMFANFTNEGRTTYHRIDMRKGEETADITMRITKYRIPVVSGNNQQIKIVHPWNVSDEGTSGPSYFAGLSIDGMVFPIDLGIKRGRYLTKGISKDDYVGFVLRFPTAKGINIKRLWISPRSVPATPENVANDVLDFAMLGKGNVVFTTDVYEGKHKPGTNKRAEEAFFHAHLTNTRWNVLEGIERLPKMEKVDAENKFIEESMSVRLIESFGDEKHKPMAMCLYHHSRSDTRSLVLVKGTKSFQPVNWRRAIVVTHDGERLMTPLFREGDLPEQIWLHHAGKLITGKYVWSGPVTARQRQVQLSMYMLR